MDPRSKSALLWGAVGFMTFLVLVQGATLLGERLLSPSQTAVIAVVVGAVTAAFAYRFEHRIAARAARRTRR